MYHYIPALMVGMMVTAFALDRLEVAARRAGWAMPSVATYAVAAVVAAGFLYWGLPDVYGYPLTQEQRAARQWNAKW